MSTLTAWLDRTFYHEYQDRWDDIELRQWVLNRLSPESEVLDIGAGRGHKDEMDLKKRCKFVAGVDPDRAVLSNRFVHEARVQEPPRYEIPYPANRFDLVYCNSVIEHLDEPDRFFSDVLRVLKPGGTFIAKTPNRYHYVAQIASVTPHWFHAFYNRMRGRETIDTFPTYYKCNTRNQIWKTAQAAGFEVKRISILEGRPEYCRCLFPAYLMGIAYERVVNCNQGLEQFRCVALIAVQKPEKADSFSELSHASNDPAV